MNYSELNLLLTSFKERVPYTIYSSLNKKHSISAKFSKHKILGAKESYIDKLLKLRLVNNDYNTIFEDINKAYLDNIEYGSKYIQFFKFSPADFADIYRLASNLTVNESDFKESYPYLIDKNELSKNQINKVHLVDVKQNENKMTLVFTRVVEFNERVKIESDQIYNDQLTGDYTHFYGVRNYLKQFVDIVCFDKRNNTIEIRIDYFKGTSDRKIQNHFSNFFASFKLLLGTSLKMGIFDRNKLNIHSVIKKFNTDNSGRAVELCFSTKEGSNIQIRKRRACHDIREEAYHKAGSNAVLDQLDIYRIGIVWENENGVELEILVPGSSLLVHAITKEINEVIISNCTGIQDFSFLKTKITNALSN